MPSEAVAIVNICKSLQIENLIESGRWKGFSTEYFARQSEHFMNIISVDYRYQPFYKEVEKRLLAHSNIHLLYGNSFGILPFLVLKFKEPSALFLDGPKGAVAVKLIKLCFSLNPMLKVAFLHDCYRGSVARVSLSSNFPDAWFTDDLDFCIKYLNVDRGAIERIKKSVDNSWRSKYSLKAECTNSELSYGPTLGCVTRPNWMHTCKPGFIELKKLIGKYHLSLFAAKARLFFFGTRNIFS